MSLSRRSLLLGSSAALAGTAIPWGRLFGRSAEPMAGRFGPLSRDPAGILDLPRGFSYRVLQRKGDVMTDGYRVPGAFDGMACFPGPDQTLVLMRNHELDRIGLPGPYRPGQRPPKEAYDPEAMGGVTRLVLRADTLDPVSSNLVLVGTSRKCAGGMSPWGWLSCEEIVQSKHGYVFLCRTEADRVAEPRLIAGYGHFRHEAVAVDPITHVAYLTEDEVDGCFYRFVPRSKGEPFEGRLQAMCVRSRPRFDTGSSAAPRTTSEIDWVDVADSQGTRTPVREQALERGAAVVRRGEGAWYESGVVWFVSTSGGPANAGQIFKLQIGRAPKEGDRLTLVAQSTSPDALNMPDNVTVAPWGDVFIAEDCLTGTQYLRLLEPSGAVSAFARNAVSGSELAGVCFSPDGSTLFVNVYGDGLTLAIRGPFRPAS